MEVFDETTDNVVVGKVTGHVKKGLTGKVVDGSVDGDFGLFQEKDGRHEVATGDFGKVGDGSGRLEGKERVFGGDVVVIVIVFVGDDVVVVIIVGVVGVIVGVGFGGDGCVDDVFVVVVVVFVGVYYYVVVVVGGGVVVGCVYCFYVN